MVGEPSKEMKKKLAKKTKNNLVKVLIPLVVGLALIVVASATIGNGILLVISTLALVAVLPKTFGNLLIYAANR